MQLSKSLFFNSSVKCEQSNQGNVEKRLSEVLSTGTGREIKRTEICSRRKRKGVISLELCRVSANLLAGLKDTDNDKTDQACQYLNC